MNGANPQSTTVRFTPAEMEMVRTLYQNGDKALNTVNEQGEPFYMQLETLMRESTERRSALCEATVNGTFCFLGLLLGTKKAMSNGEYTSYWLICYSQGCEERLVLVL